MRIAPNNPGRAVLDVGAQSWAGKGFLRACELEEGGPRAPSAARGTWFPIVMENCGRGRALSPSPWLASHARHRDGVRFSRTGPVVPSCSRPLGSPQTPISLQSLSSSSLRWGKANHSHRDQRRTASLLLAAPVESGDVANWHARIFKCIYISVFKWGAGSCCGTPVTHQGKRTGQPISFLFLYLYLSQQKAPNATKNSKTTKPQDQNRFNTQEAIECSVATPCFDPSPRMRVR